MSDSSTRICPYCGERFKLNSASIVRAFTVDECRSGPRVRCPHCHMFAFVRYWTSVALGVCAALFATFYVAANWVVLTLPGSWFVLSYLHVRFAPLMRQ